MIFFWYVVSILLLVAILDLPSEYYDFLRVSVFSVSAFVAYKNYEAKDNAMAVAFVIVAVLFNPIYPIYLDNKALWKFINFSTAVLFILNARKINAGSTSIKIFTKLSDLIKRYKQQLTIGLTVLALGIGITFYYNYQQEQERKAYYAVDKTDYFNCDRWYFGLNSSPSTREDQKYRSAIWINYEYSESGLSEPSIKKNIDITYTPDYIKVWNGSYMPLHYTSTLARPTFMIDRINGDLLDLEGGQTIRCGLLDNWCNLDDDKEKIEQIYTRYTCQSKTEAQFYDRFERDLKRYEGERKF